MKITESHLRSIIKEELKNILFEEKSRLIAGIPDWAVMRAFKYEKMYSDTPGNERTALPHHLANVIHGEDAVNRNPSLIDKYYDIVARNFDELQIYYSNTSSENRRQRSMTGNERNDEFAKNHGF